MPLQKLALTAGINKEGTNYSNEGGWYDCDKVRFRSGNPEKLGGWVRLSDNRFLGTARDLHNWANFAQEVYLGVGTNLKYYIELGGVYNDITPIRATYISPATNNCITTASGSAEVVFTIASHGAENNDFVTISGATSVGGVPAVSLNTSYQVHAVTTNTFTITVPSPATSTVSLSGGTGITLNFQIHVGGDVYSVGLGWGAGGWGRGGWGSAATIGVVQQLRLWTSDNYGQDFIIAPRGEALYYWANSGGVGAPASLLSGLATTAGYSGAYVPTKTLQIVASAVQRFVIAFGSNPYTPGTPGSAFDPMIVRWSDQANPYQWVPAITNQAGEYRLSAGSTIIAAQVVKQEILIWTDSAIYSMQYIGPPYIWQFTQIMGNISIMSPNAAVTANNVTYWMGRDKFYVYNGTVSTLPCTLKQWVFDDMNTAQSFQFFGGGNASFNEVWWFYCSLNSTTVDRYVIYNYLDNVWYHGSLARTAWVDSGMRIKPSAAAYNNRVLYHEAAVDDESEPLTVPINAYVQSSDFDLEDGQHFGFVWRMLPDVNFNGSSVASPYTTITLAPRRNSGTPYGVANVPTVASGNDYSGANPREYVVQLFTGQVYTRLRGRQMSFRIESNSLGVAWQLGNTRFDIKPDGRR